MQMEVTCILPDPLSMSESGCWQETARSQHFPNEELGFECLWRRFIAAQAGAAKAGAQLCSGFPAQPLPDDSATLEAAGLCNAVVTLR